MKEPAEIIRITIRTGVAVSIHGIPWDFTKAEAERVAGVVRSFAICEPNNTLPHETPRPAGEGE